jgi:alpha-beta hydrolase superfamily lysophospholipase
VPALIWVTLAAAVVLLYALDRVAQAAVRPMPREPDRTASELGLPHEDIVVSHEDHVLNGWLLHPEEDEGKPLVLLAHGWGANYGVLLELAEPLLREGHPVLLFDIRGHGTNEEVIYVTVRHFRDDVLAVSLWAADRVPDRPRVLVGHSLGGAASVLAAAEGAPVHGVVTIAAPANVMEVTADYLRDKGFPGGFMVVALRPFWWRRVRGTFRRLVPEREIRRLRQPVPVVHPEEDRRVGRDHAERLALSAGVRARIIPGAGHTDVLGRTEAHRALVAFLEGVAASEEARAGA